MNHRLPIRNISRIFHNFTAVLLKVSHLFHYSTAVLLLFGCLLLAGFVTPALAVTPSIAAGDFYTVALKNDGTVWAWGGETASASWVTAPPPTAPLRFSLSSILALSL
ncbi:MAG: RCC1 domain-containing protein [Pseudomonadota bacterium]